MTVDNYAAMVLVGPVVARALKIAPAVMFDFRPSGTLDLADMLDRGEIDLAIETLPEAGRTIFAPAAAAG